MGFNSGFKGLKEIDAQSVCWIDLACDRDKWRALVKARMDLCVFVECREFLN